MNENVNEHIESLNWITIELNVAVKPATNHWACNRADQQHQAHHFAHQMKNRKALLVKRCRLTRGKPGQRKKWQLGLQRTKTTICQLRCVLLSASFRLHPDSIRTLLFTVFHSLISCTTANSVIFFKCNQREEDNGKSVRLIHDKLRQMVGKCFHMLHKCLVVISSSTFCKKKKECLFKSCFKSIKFT